LSLESAALGSRERQEVPEAMLPETAEQVRCEAVQVKSVGWHNTQVKPFLYGHRDKEVVALVQVARSRVFNGREGMTKGDSTHVLELQASPPRPPAADPQHPPPPMHH